MYRIPDTPIVYLRPQRGSAPPATIVDRRLNLHTPLSPESLVALHELLGRPMTFAADTLIAEAGEAADIVTILKDGFACRMSLLPDGRRQIHSVFLPGDTVDAETSLLSLRPDNIEALTACSGWRIPKSRLAGLLHTQPQLTEAFARETAITAQAAREWVVNIGQRTAIERISHLICELYLRLEAVGLASNDNFFQPMTQQEIGDAQGLSAVHVNRVLHDLRTQELIRTERRQLWILDKPRLQRLALFDPLYLHILHKAA